MDPLQFKWTSKISRIEIDFLDLTIRKHETFESTGQICTRTYKKPICMPQYLPFLAEHAFSCRASIYTGEVTRRLINCSAPSDYDSSLSELRTALVKRGYPSALLEHVPYDENKRNRLLSKFRQRERVAFASENSMPAEGARLNNMIIFKCPFGRHIRQLRLHHACNSLIRTLRLQLGQAFQQNVRIFIAHTTTVNLFVKTLRYNYLPTFK